MEKQTLGESFDSGAGQGAADGKANKSILGSHTNPSGDNAPPAPG